MDNQDIIAQIEDADRRLAVFSTVDSETFKRSYAPGKWTASEILAHLSYVDVAFYYRFLKGAAEDGSEIVPFDENVWQGALEAQRIAAAASIAVIRGVHAGIVHYLRILPAATLDRVSHHPERGPMSALRLAKVLAGHTHHHLGQLEAIREGRGWTRAEAVAYWD